MNIGTLNFPIVATMGLLQAPLLDANRVDLNKKPVAANTKPDSSDDPEGQQKNRRVEIVLEK